MRRFPCAAHVLLKLDVGIKPFMELPGGVFNPSSPRAWRLHCRREPVIFNGDLRGLPSKSAAGSLEMQVSENGRRGQGGRRLGKALWFFHHHDRRASGQSLYGTSIIWDEKVVPKL